MLNIKNEVLNDEANLNLFVQNLLDKSGLVRNTSKLVDYIEDDINGRYRNGDSSVCDTSTATYGGVVYEGYGLVSSGVVEVFVKRLLTSDEVAYITEISNGDLHLSVERSDFELYQVWGLVVEVMLDEGSDVITLDIEMKVSNTDGSIKSIATEFCVESTVMNDMERKRLASSF